MAIAGARSTAAYIRIAEIGSENGKRRYLIEVEPDPVAMKHGGDFICWWRAPGILLQCRPLAGIHAPDKYLRFVVDGDGERINER